MDFQNKTATDSVWHIITNTHAIAVNQAWADHPGTTFDLGHGMGSQPDPRHDAEGALRSDEHLGEVRSDGGGGGAAGADDATVGEDERH